MDTPQRIPRQLKLSSVSSPPLPEANSVLSESLLTYEPTPNAAFSLRVDGGDPMVAVEVFDAQYQSVASGLGKLEIDLPPGLYQAVARAGDGVNKTDILLLQPEQVTFTPPRLTTSAPLTTSTRQGEEPSDLSRAFLDISSTSVSAESATLMVFVQRAKTKKEDPSRFLRLCTLEGKLIHPFQQSQEQGETWGVTHLALEPGMYRLGVDTSLAGTLELLLPLFPGWQTQIFLSNRSWKTQSDIRLRPDLSTASIYLSPAGVRFQAEAPQNRWTEQLRLSLQSGSREGAPPEAAETLTDPMALLYAAHLELLRQEQQQREQRTKNRERPEPSTLFHACLHKLRELVPNHPDLPILDPEQQTELVTTPPMLLRSWELLVQQSLEHPGRIPDGSLAARIATGVRSDGVFLVWNRGAASTATQQKSPRDFLDMTESSLLYNFNKQQTNTPLQTYGTSQFDNLSSPNEAEETYAVGDVDVLALSRSLGLPPATVRTTLRKVAGSPKAKKS